MRIGETRPIRLAWVAAAAGVSSLAVTAAARLLPLRPAPAPMLAEAVMLGVLVFATARWSPVRSGAVGGFLAGLAMVLIMLRSPEQISAGTAVAAGGVWTLGPVTAASAGLYLRQLRAARERAVAAARRAQRSELARDLHDYVAHDVSEMLAHAQAAQLLDSSPASKSALRHIEEAGLRAMAVMDRTVRMLHDDRTDADAARTRAPAGIDDLPALAERFATASAVRVLLTRSPGLAAATPREVSGLVHRIVVEALTNIRRHAPAVTEVLVDVRLVGDTVEVTVVNDGGTAPRAAAPRRGGLGITGLSERAAALGGTLAAGPHGPGWRLHAALPLSADDRRGGGPQ